MKIDYKNICKKSFTFFVCSLLFSLANCQNKFNHVVEKTTPGAKNMSVALENIIFTIPKGYADKGVHAFFNKERTQKVEVWRETFVSEQKAFVEIIQEYRERINTKVPDLPSSKIVAEENDTLAGLPAYKFVVESTYRQETRVAHLFLVRDTPNSYIEFTLEFPANTADLEKRFNEIEKSAVLSSQESKSDIPVPEGYKKVYAGALQLNIPNELKGRDILELEREKANSENRVAIDLQTFLFPPEKSLDAEAEGSNIVGAISLADSQPVKTGNIDGTIRKYSLSIQELGMPAETATLFLAEIKTINGSVVRVKSNIPVSEESEVKNSFIELIESIKSK